MERRRSIEYDSEARRKIMKYRRKKRLVISQSDPDHFSVTEYKKKPKKKKERMSTKLLYELLQVRIRSLEKRVSKLEGEWKCNPYVDLKMQGG